MSDASAALRPTPDCDDWGVEEETRVIAPAALPRPAQAAPTPSPSAFPPPAQEPFYPTETWPHLDKPLRFPAFIARGGLFRVGRAIQEWDASTTREVASQRCSMTVQGPRLTMRDKLVWEGVVAIARERSPTVGLPMRLPLFELAARMGLPKAVDGTSQRLLLDSLRRLAATRVAARLEAGMAEGMLLAEVAKNGDKVMARLDARFTTQAFLLDRQFAIDSARRESISSTVGQWLHDFYSTHAKPKALTVDHLREHCGFDGKPKEFPKLLWAGFKGLIAAAPSVVSAVAIDRRGLKSSGLWHVTAMVGAKAPQFTRPPAASKPQARSTARSGLSL